MIKDKWQKMSLSQQMGNIGSEVCRMLMFRQKGDKKQKKKSGERALELIDLTIEDSRWRGRKKEIFRLRDVVADIFAEAGNFNISPDSLNNYFLPFSIQV